MAASFDALLQPYGFRSDITGRQEQGILTFRQRGRYVERHPDL
jgi:hypothetical protein